MCHQCSDTVGWASRHLAGKKRVMRCWCRLFAYGPADASAIPKSRHLLPHLNSDWFYLSGNGLPRLSWKEATKQV